MGSVLLIFVGRRGDWEGRWGKGGSLRELGGFVVMLGCWSVKIGSFCGSTNEKKLFWNCHLFGKLCERQPANQLKKNASPNKLPFIWASCYKSISSQTTSSPFFKPTNPIPRFSIPCFFSHNIYNLHAEISKKVGEKVIPALNHPAEQRLQIAGQSTSSLTQK